jgi:hypothetical protein
LDRFDPAGLHQFYAELPAPCRGAHAAGLPIGSEGEYALVLSPFREAKPTAKLFWNEMVIAPERLREAARRSNTARVF